MDQLGFMISVGSSQVVVSVGSSQVDWGGNKEMKTSGGMDGKKKGHC